jgi:predicted DNA-binding transcriptional regulator AlpA
MTNSDQFPHHTLSESQAARYIGVSGAVLRLWRSRSEGPRHFKAGSKLVRYLKSDLDQWIEKRLIQTQP